MLHMKKPTHMKIISEIEQGIQELYGYEYCMKQCKLKIQTFNRFYSFNCNFETC